MRKKWPNTRFWQYADDALRIIRPTGRRRYGEKLFGVAPGGLRALIDRKLSPAEVARFDSVLAGALRQHASELRAKADEAARAANAIDRDLAYRRADYMDTPRDRLIQQWVDWGICIDTTEAA